MKTAVVGAGVLGRVLALELRRRGCEVDLWDDGRGGCSPAGAGLLAPLSEIEHGPPEEGWRSLRLWPGILAGLARPVFFQQAGTLVVAHPLDEPELRRFEGLLAGHPAEPVSVAALEPELAERFSRGLFLPGEGQIDPGELLAALGETLRDSGVRERRATVTACFPHGLEAEGERLRYDEVFSCRGLRARLADLRGVRGERFTVEAPEVRIGRPVRLMHPRYPLYVAPRPGHRYVIGATLVESEDEGPVTVRSALELLSAAYALHPGFGEARVVESPTACRPAFGDNRPRITGGPGYREINGLYRHGYLLAPGVVETLLQEVFDESDDQRRAPAMGRSAHGARPPGGPGPE